MTNNWSGDRFTVQLLVLLCVASIPLCSWGGEFEPRAIAITNATVIASPGLQIEQARVVIREGLIHSVGKDIPIPADAEVIDAHGLFVYPGFIDSGTNALINEQTPATPAPPATIDVSRFALAATRIDQRKSLTPDFIAADNLRLDKDQIEKRRALGFTVLHVVPAGRLASGQSALLTTGGETLRQSLLKSSTTSQFRVFAPGEEGYPNTLMGGTAHLRQVFLDARRYQLHHSLYNSQTAGIPRPLEDRTLQALQVVLKQELPAWFYAQTRDEIDRALDFTTEQELTFTLWGGQDAARCLERLRHRSVAVVLTVDHGDEPKIESPPADSKLMVTRPDPTKFQESVRSLWRKRVAGANLLHQAGLKIAAGTQGLKDPADFFKGLRNLIQGGLPRDVALAAITRDAALILGQSSRLGTIEPGKLGHVVVLTGPFDDERTKVRFVLVDGRKFEYHKDAQSVPRDSGSSKLNLSGNWKIRIESAEGPVDADMKLIQTGTRLNGSFKSSRGEGKLTSGKIENGQIEWVVSIGAGAQDIELRFQAVAQATIPSPAAAVAPSAAPPAAATKPPASPITVLVQGDKPLSATSPENIPANVLKGTLKSAFGAPTGFTAIREFPSEISSNKVELQGIETDEGKPEPPRKPEEIQPVVVDLPAETPEDRVERSLKTGGNVLIRNGTILTGRGTTLPETSLLIQQGKITAIGKDLHAPEGVPVIDATGRFLMPGIIDTHSHIMIGDGLGGVNEATLSMVPEVRVKDSVSTEDVAAFRALAGGVTTARLFHGSANVIGGQDAVVKLRYGEPASSQIIADAPQGVKFALGENVKFQQNRFPNTRMGVEATLNRAFLEALDYRRQWMEFDRSIEGHPEKARQVLPPRRDLRLEALKDIVNQQKFIHSHCYRADEILMLLRIADGIGVRVWSLQHVLEGYKVAPEIKAHGASCSTFSDWWAYKIEAYDATPFNAAFLFQSGVNAVIKSDDHELIRHLYLEAAKTMRYGNLAPDQAIQTVTYNSARELGLQDRIGSLEVGKQGDVGIYNGHPLHAFSRCEMTLIEGEVYFTREALPSAMSATGAARQQTSPTIPLPPLEIREKTVDLSTSPQGRYALVGGTIHPIDGPDVIDGTLLIADGIITGLGKDIPIPGDTKSLDVTGLHLYPGLIDAGTTVGLVEIGKVKETHDYAESGQFQPDLRAGVAVNPDSELIPVARAGGITTVLTLPTGGIIAGQASAMKLGGWTVPEMVLDLEVGLSVRWPGAIHKPRSTASRGHSSSPSVEELTKKREERIEELKEFLKAGRLYLKIKADAQAANVTGPVPDPRYEALRPYLAGEKPVFFEAHERMEIAECLLFAEAEKLKPIITGGTDAWKLAPELKARNVPVIVGPVMARPIAEYDPFDAPYANPGRLFEAGVMFAIHSEEASQSRNVPFEAAQAVAYGLPELEALKAVTLYPAKILGLDNKIGSLTVGKLAHIVITDGSPLLHSTQIKGTFVDGRPYPPETRQTRLYEKYRQRMPK